MPSGDRSRTWFPEMIEQLRQRWRGDIEMDELIASLREYTIAIQQRPGFAAAYQGRSVVKLALGDSAGSHEDLGKIAR